ncbi:hypothetical protein [Cellulosilyticum ruminicola]|uniref:hypothetical protein n=1 Tax=Cellulosilyticum ruminicola TaxID=425254 RepID=UPI0006D18BC6|nr:hypothetical protein [Cellulosilyticum ruminicola]
MKKRWFIMGSIILATSMSFSTIASVPVYYDQQEYMDALYDNYSEERGIVIENNPQLGYITYRNGNGATITRNYYTNEISVEKQPYYETEDKIGYLDEIFPYFKYDARDTTIGSIKAGDCIYIRMDKDKYITYISAYNDYMMRYAKVNTFNFNSDDKTNIILEDEKGNIYSYDLELSTPVSKGGVPCSISTIKPGDWVKVLISQKILGEGIIEESIEEVVVDNDTRVISSLYKGQVTSIDKYKDLLNLKNVQSLGKLNWGKYNSLLRLNINPQNIKSYLIGNQVSLDYISRNLRNAEGYTYVAAENYKGKEYAVKLNFQSKLQNTLQPSTVIYASSGIVKLLSGENLYVAEDAIIVRDNKLVESHNIMVGDVLQAVVTGENKLAVGKISSDVTTASLEVFRGRIKKIKDSEEFQFETFSLLDGHQWYYHPTPRTFSIDLDTKFYNESGYVQGGIEKFLSYGEDSEVGNVYTVVAVGDKAYMVVKMPYVTNAAKGQVYKVEGNSVGIKDVYYYHKSQKKWVEYSKKNLGATINLGVNSVVIKNGKVIPVSKLEKGDIISTMISTNLKDTAGIADGYIIVVEN